VLAGRGVVAHDRGQVADRERLVRHAHLPGPREPVENFPRVHLARSASKGRTSRARGSVAAATGILRRLKKMSSAIVGTVTERISLGPNDRQKTPKNQVPLTPHPPCIVDANRFYHK
jgi:hypothetical protein